MATVEAIAEALRSVADTALADVDQSSIGDFLPAITTQKIALCVVPFRQRDRIEWANLAGTLDVTHEIQLQFWVKLTNTPAGTALCMQRARDIGLEAAREIAGNDGAGYDLAMDSPLFTTEVDEDIFDVNGVAFLRSRLTVRVRNEVTVT